MYFCYYLKNFHRYLKVYIAKSQKLDTNSSQFIAKIPFLHYLQHHKRAKKFEFYKKMYDLRQNARQNIKNLHLIIYITTIILIFDEF